MRALTALVGALLEAWQEVRVHRTRVLLSLVGVAVAVCSLTTVVALGAIVQQANQELSERSSGRPATLHVAAFRTDGVALDAKKVDAAWPRSSIGTGVVRHPCAERVAARAVPRRSGRGRRAGRRSALRRDAPRADGRGRVVHDPRRAAARAAPHRQQRVLGPDGESSPLESPVVALGGQGVPHAASGIPAGGTTAVVVGWCPRRRGRPSRRCSCSPITVCDAGCRHRRARCRSPRPPIPTAGCSADAV